MERLRLRWTVGLKMQVLGLVILSGMVALGGIGLWAGATMEQASEKALQSENQARELAELNGALIDLMFLATDGPAHPEKGITAEDIIEKAQSLATRAEALIADVPGADEVVVEKSQMTCGDQVAGNFYDIADALTFELPDIYEAYEDSETFARKRGDLVLSLNRFYSFISRSLGKLSANASAESRRARAEMAETASNARTGIVVTFVLSLVVLLPAFILFRRHLVLPLRKTVDMADSLKRGRVKARLNVGDRKDEFGDMAQSLNAFAESLETDMVVVMQAVARGDLTVQTHPEGQEDVVRGTLEEMRMDLAALILRLRQAINRVASGSEQISSAAQSMSEGATEQASALEEISSSMVELSEQARQNASHAREANDLSNQVRDAATLGASQMSDLVGAMEEIDNSSRRITGIIKTIDEIAFQTNLLALNASVEAARAGQHGKGFAVVAEEVRNLASRSARAARETSELVEGSVVKAARGKTLAHQTSTSLESIEQGVSKISTLIEEITAASEEQAQGVVQSNQGLEQINTVTQRNTATSEESASSAQELAYLAGELEDMVERFRVEEAQVQVQPVLPYEEQ